MAKKRSPLSDTDLVAAISAAEQQALSTLQGDIASDRADAIDRYLGKPYSQQQAAGVSLAAQPGRSSVVSRDVSDVVQGVLANVLKPFVGGDRVVEFTPRGPEDEEQAEQETDYVNFVALERNNGFVTLASAIQDALLLRAGYVKCNWTTRQDVLTETYQGQSDEQLAMLMQDDDVEVVEHTEYPDLDPAAAAAGTGPMAVGAQGLAGVSPPAMAQGGGMPPASMLHDVKVRRTKPTEFVETLPAPPDEILVTVRAREPSLQNADFVQHRTSVTVSELREMGYDVPDDVGSQDDNGETLEDFSRQRFASSTDIEDDDTQDPARRLVRFKESWIRIDRDGDGIAELRRVCMVGKVILADEEADIIPIAAGTGTLMPHQHLGLSVYDHIKDLAEIKTAILRQYLDNKYLQNNPRTYVNMDADVNIDDVMTSRPGGVIRGHGPGELALTSIVIPDTGTSALQALEYLDSIRENRTGYTKAAEGIKSGSLATGTLGELQQQMSQSSLRLEMICRTIAETLVKDLYRIVHALTLKHATKEEKVRLRNKWVNVNPREWVRRTDLQISVGLGNVSQMQQTQGLMMIGQAQQQAVQMGLVTPENVYNLCSKLTNAQGFKNPDSFFTAPEQKPKIGPDGQPVIGADGKPEMESVPPPQPPNPIVQAEQIKAQAAGQAAQIKAQTDQQIAGMKAQSDAAVQQARANADMQVQQHKIQTDAQLEMAKHEMQLKFDDFRHQREQQTQIAVANIKAAAQVESAKISAKMGFDQAVLQSEMQGSQTAND